MTFAPSMNPFQRLLGFIACNGAPGTFTSAAAAANKEVQAVAVALPFGEPIGNIVLQISTAGSGATPTGFFVGIGNLTVMKAQSGNLNASTSLTTLGLQSFALSASYTPIPADTTVHELGFGLFYIVFLQDGAFGGTNVQFARTGGISAVSTGIQIIAGRAGTTQTALATNGSAYSSALAAAGGQNWFVGTRP